MKVDSYVIHMPRTITIFLTMPSYTAKSLRTWDNWKDIIADNESARKKLEEKDRNIFMTWMAPW